MSHDYRLTPEAQAIVDKICGFIAEDSVDAALRVLDALENAFRLLAAELEAWVARRAESTCWLRISGG